MAHEFGTRNHPEIIPLVAGHVRTCHHLRQRGKPQGDLSEFGRWQQNREEMTGKLEIYGKWDENGMKMG